MSKRLIQNVEFAAVVFRNLSLVISMAVMPLVSMGQETFNTIRHERKIPVVDIVQSKNSKDVVPGLVRNVDEQESKEITIKGIAGMPLRNIIVTSSFGKRKDPFTGKLRSHKGIDLKAKEDSVLSILPGIISKVYYHKKLGITIEVKHGSFTSIYGHLRHAYVNKGSRVMDGQCIGLSGNTGRSTGPHLHFSLRYRGKIVNPLPYLLEIRNQLGSSRE